MCHITLFSINNSIHSLRESRQLPAQWMGPNKNLAIWAELPRVPLEKTQIKTYSDLPNKPTVTITEF